MSRVHQDSKRIRPGRRRRQTSRTSRRSSLITISQTSRSILTTKNSLLSSFRLEEQSMRSQVTEGRDAFKLIQRHIWPYAIAFKRIRIIQWPHATEIGGVGETYSGAR